MIDVQQTNTAPAMPHNSNRLRTILSNVALLVFAPLISFLLTFFVFQTYQVDGMSMETTLQNHDRLIVWKAPQTFAHIINSASVPSRYDIIVFKKDHVPGMMNGESQLIKRVISLPGERVVVTDGHVAVYTVEHPEGFNPDSGQSYAMNQSPTPGDVDVVVPAGHVFVLGDNRGNSYDSPDFGTVPASDIVGTLAMRVAPLGHAQTF